jgi:formyl-CoA transferase
MGAVRQIGSPMRFSATPAVRAAAGPLLGADTEAVLAEFGFEPDAIDELIASGVVASMNVPRLAADPSA